MRIDLPEVVAEVKEAVEKHERARCAFGLTRSSAMIIACVLRSQLP